MPNETLPLRSSICASMRSSICAMTLATLLLLAGCASREVSPDILLEAEDAIALAVAAGAEDHAPLELGEARDWIAQADAAVEAGDASAAAYLVERATLQARLAIARAQGSITRSELEQRRDDYQRLRDEMTDAFGNRVLEGSR